MVAVAERWRGDGRVEELKLQVRNPHFNMLPEIRRALEMGGINEEYVRAFRANFESALAEDWLITGEVRGGLGFFEEGGRVIFTTEECRGLGLDLVEVAERAVEYYESRGESTRRARAELEGVRRLREWAATAKEGSKLLLTYPPGTKEEGFYGESRTYVYEVVGVGERPRLRCFFGKSVLSLEGHIKLWEEVSEREYDGEVSDTGLASRPVEIGVGVSLTSHEEVFGRIGQLMREGMVDGGVELGKGVTAERFEMARVQIEEAAEFVLGVMRNVEKRRRIKGRVYQEDVDDLERAYSMARRVVERLISGGSGLVNRGVMMADFGQVERVRRELEVGRNRLTGETDWQLARRAALLQTELQDRYGGTGEVRVGGGGCPGGEIVGIGVGEVSYQAWLTNSIVINESGYKGPWHRGSCRCCHKIDVDVGECNVCKQCQYEFDRGIRN